MKLLFIYNYFVLKAGLERILADRLNVLAEKYNCDVYFLVKNQNGQPLAFPLSPKVHFIDLHFQDDKIYRHKFPLRLFYKKFYSCIDKKRLHALIKEISPDIISFPTAFDSDLLLGLSKSIPVIVESHEDRDSLIELLASRTGNFYYIRRFLLNRAFIRMQRNAAAIVCMSDLEKDVWEKYGNNVVKIHNFTSFITKANNCSSIDLKKTVIAAGRICDAKGFDMLVSAWKSVYIKHKDWKLLIYATTGPVSELERMIEEQDLNSTIRIMPPSTEMEKVYEGCDFYALSSRHEGFGLVLAEALSMGKPCVAFDCPFGPREIIVDGKNGLLVENGNIHAFSAALCRMIEDDDLRIRCSENARYSVKKFSESVVMPQWISLYQSVVKR